MSEDKILVDTFIEVEIRDPEPVEEDGPEKPEKEEKKEQQSQFYFKCSECHSSAVATNGAMILQNPTNPMEDPKKYDVDYLYCPKCEILENMEGKTFEKQVFVQKVESDTPKVKRILAQKIREDIFSSQ